MGNKSHITFFFIFVKGEFDALLKESFEKAGRYTHALKHTVWDTCMYRHARLQGSRHYSLPSRHQGSTKSHGQHTHTHQFGPQDYTTDMVIQPQSPHDEYRNDDISTIKHNEGGVTL